VEPKVMIQNVVVSAAMRHGFDLDTIVLAFPHVEYMPHRFPGLCYRLEKPKTSTLIFRTGKMVCTGAKSERVARRAIHKVLRELKAKGIISRGRPEITVQNIVASAELGGEIDLESLVYKFGRVMYEPEQFPAAIHRMDEPKVVFLIFSNGKLVVTGAKKEEEVYEAVERLQHRIEEEELIS
jgi:transcription initiation factor TFIID TATA-box-binding protein